MASVICWGQEDNSDLMNTDNNMLQVVLKSTDYLKRILESELNLGCMTHKEVFYNQSKCVNQKTKNSES